MAMPSTPFFPQRHRAGEGGDFAIVGHLEGHSAPGGLEIGEEVLIRDRNSSGGTDR
jgi:hypothetical protein